ncbi:MAG TPA: sulfur carrier protein ThiS [Ramlibacter sp.]|nr:sulfur carrier protein ThiS [Ramlibacter sp.]
MTQVTLNGEPKQLQAGATLADLIASISEKPQALATAVNGEFVPRDARDQMLLREGDAVFIFQPITGG